KADPSGWVNWMSRPTKPALVSSGLPELPFSVRSPPTVSRSQLDPAHGEPNSPGVNGTPQGVWLSPTYQTGSPDRRDASSVAESAWTYFGVASAAESNARSASVDPSGATKPGLGGR